MLGKLSFALLILASSAIAAEPASEDIKVDESGQAYRIKRVCRTVEVAGSFIPRTSCVNKKILMKRPDAVSSDTAGVSGGTDNQSAKAPEE